VRMPRLDHVVLHVRPEAVLGAEERGQPRPWVGGEAVGHVPEVAVDRRRIAHEADATAVESRRFEEPFRPKTHAHARNYKMTFAERSVSGPSLVQVKAARLRSSGGAPRLLRPRYEPIEPPS